MFSSIFVLLETFCLFVGTVSCHWNCFNVVSWEWIVTLNSNVAASISTSRRSNQQNISAGVLPILGLIHVCHSIQQLQNWRKCMWLISFSNKLAGRTDPTKDILPSITASKVSIFEVFLVRILPLLDWIRGFTA